MQATQTLTFNEYKKLFQAHFAKLIKEGTTLYLTGVSRDALWDTYLASFPEAERQGFTCNSCKQFIRPYGNLVAIKNNQLISLWDFEVADPIYAKVNQNLSAFVKSQPVVDVFVSDLAKLGTDMNRQLLEGGEVIRWQHFYMQLPTAMVHRGSATVESVQSNLRGAHQVFSRSLRELSILSTQTALEMIAQGTLYRGEESIGMLTTFLAYQNEYTNLPVEERVNYCWAKFKGAGAVARMRNTAIGTLLIDINNDIDLDEVVRKFAKVMDPDNYHRPKPFVSTRTIEAAEQTIKELGLTDSLARRHAVYDDVTVANVLFADRTKAKQGGDIFAELKEDILVHPRTLKKVEQMNLADFLDKVVPTAKSLSILLEPKHEAKLVSLIAPVNMDAPALTKWDNGYTWAYSNNAADSIREKVIQAGGKVQGYFRASLEWSTYSDLDLHMTEPGGDHIYYGTKNTRSRGGGQLDVDMNAGGGRTRTPVENIIYLDSMLEGKHEIYVHNFSDRELTKSFTVEVEHAGELYTFTHNQVIRSDETVVIAKFTHSSNTGIQFEQATTSALNSTDLWGLGTHKFHQVNMVMHSPNHWANEKAVGNKHVFFMLDGAHNSGPTRGIFNEMVKEELHREHKRVFEALGMKLAVADSTPQLSGLGFSTTSQGSFYCKVQGSFERVIEVKV